VRDEDVRSSCWAALEVLMAEFGSDVPYEGGLDRPALVLLGPPRATTRF
jgi:hypothetical protein